MSKKEGKKEKEKSKYPAATLILYGPNDQVATKAVASLLRDEDSEPTDFKKWYTDGTDLRGDETIEQEIVAYMKEHGVKQVIADDRILGCPHEEGIDYPKGETCPECPFWSGGRNRFTGNIEH